MIDIINFSVIKFMIAVSIFMLFLQLPVYIAMKRKNKKFRFYHLFYVPKGRKKKAIYVHTIGLSTGLFFFLAKILAIPITLVLGFLGYVGSADTTETLILTLAVFWVLTQLINSYRVDIEKFIEKRLPVDIRG